MTVSYGCTEAVIVPGQVEMKVDGFEYACELKSLADKPVKAGLLAYTIDKTSKLRCDARDAVKNHCNTDNHTLSFSFFLLCTES